MSLGVFGAIRPQIIALSITQMGLVPVSQPSALAGASNRLAVILFRSVVQRLGKLHVRAPTYDPRLVINVA